MYVSLSQFLVLFFPMWTVDHIIFVIFYPINNAYCLVNGICKIASTKYSYLLTGKWFILRCVESIVSVTSVIFITMSYVVIGVQ